ncbi:hypothetical protein CRG98_009950 [Punica granatum]|uniref:Uncharacterized protein n=1 Tax=Punica granatum TaxID=22663 RepID=A0A2I0KMJ7_PUNGR|nr:hypothetical protein CRG98_009950 [Punica granatum]
MGFRHEQTLQVALGPSQRRPIRFVGPVRLVCPHGIRILEPSLGRLLMPICNRGKYTYTGTSHGEEQCTGSRLLKNSSQTLSLYFDEGGVRRRGTPHEAEARDNQTNHSTSMRASPPRLSDTLGQIGHSPLQRPITDNMQQHSTLELESLVQQSRHPQRTNRSSWGPNPRQGNTRKSSNCLNSNVGPPDRLMFASRGRSQSQIKKRVRALAQFLPHIQRQGTSGYEERYQGSRRDQKDASHDLWLHLLIEHATKEGQVVSTPFWPIGSNRDHQTEAWVTIRGRADGSEHTTLGTWTTEERQAPLRRHIGQPEKQTSNELQNNECWHYGTIHRWITGAS